MRPNANIARGMIGKDRQKTIKGAKMKYSFAGRVRDSHGYIDFDINTDNPNEYWVLSYDREARCWYANQRVAGDDEGPFEEGRTATNQEVSDMLATMPINELPASALLGG